MATLRSEEYWERRAAARMDMIQADAEETLQKLNRAYRAASASMSVQINAMIRSFGKRYGLTEEEAAEILKKPASRESLEALKEAIKNMPEGRDKQKMIAELNAPSARFRISNTQAMREQAQAVCSRLAEEEKKLFTDSLTKSISEAYLHTAYDLQKGVGLGWKTTGISNRLLDQLLREDWSGASYQTRIMGRYSDLGREMSTLMLEGMLGGRSRAQMIEEMQHQFAMNARDARRLLVTETTYVTNAAQKRLYEDEGIEEYSYQAILDLKTSEICENLDGMIMKVKYAKPGKNFPPMHPNCRSTTIAVLDREWLATVTRKAIDPITGETITLPPNTSYKGWYKMLVDKHGEETLRSAKKTSANRVDKSKDRHIIITDKQIGHKGGKHLQDWGLDPTNAEDRKRFREITIDIVRNYDELRRVQWYQDAKTGRRTVYVNAYIKGDDVVLVRDNNEYVTTMKGGKANKLVQKGKVV